MNPGLANTPLQISRPAVRGGFDFSASSAAPVAGFTFRARRLANKAGGETMEGGRLRDFQVARFQIRKGEWIIYYEEGDHLTEELSSSETLTWQVRTWAEVPGTRGLWVEVQCEEVRDGGEG